MNSKVNGDDLDIPDFLKRTADKEAAVMSEVQMSEVDTTVDPAETPKARKPRKAKAKAAAKGNGASKAAKAAKPAPAKAKAASKPAKAKAKAKARVPAEADEFGFKVGSLKSKAAAMYASKGGATLEEVKDKLSSVQLNLLTTLKGQGYKVSKVKEDGPGARKVTRYFLRAK